MDRDNPGSPAQIRLGRLPFGPASENLLKENDDVVLISDEDDWQDYEYSSKDEKDEMKRLISLVQGTVVTKENQIVTQTAATASTGRHPPNK